MRSPVEGAPRRLTPQKTTIHGRPKGKFTIGEWLHGVRKRKQRELKNKITLKKQREKVRDAIDSFWDRITFGKTRRKLDRLRKHGYTSKTEIADAGLPQTETYCHRYTGRSVRQLSKLTIVKHPLDKKGRERKGEIECPSCKLHLKLEGGKLPAHKPGPPPFTHCPRCNAFFANVYRGIPNWRKLKRIGGCYNDILCPACYRDTEIEGGGTSWTTPDGDIILPHEMAALNAPHGVVPGRSVGLNGSEPCTRMST